MKLRLSDSILAPRPVRIEDAAGTFFGTPNTRIVAPACSGEAIAAQLAGDLAEACGPRESEPQEAEIALQLDPSGAPPPEAYSLRVATGRITIRAASERGLFMGRTTLRQLLIQGRGSVPCGQITDAPAFASRGYMLDVSRGKVPTMETLLAFLEQLSHFKFNQFQLYTEHTFAYKAHRKAWEAASPFTPEEIREIDAFCQARFIEFVPNQNSLGHMEQWLKHPEYAHLAECPEGFQDPWTPDWRTPSTISPVLAGSLELVSELYAELLPNFTSGLFNVGCDEPFELGQGLSAARSREVGRGRVYLDWLLELHKLCRAHGRRMLFWADIISEHPELVSSLPMDMIPLEWGYEKGHPWDDRCARFAEAGLSFYVCPGTSTWNSISGRTANALANLREAAQAGVRHSAAGYLLTEWGDVGHRQFLPLNHLPMIAAACCAWNPSRVSEVEVARAADVFVLRDATGTMGRWLLDFGNLYLCDPSPPPNHARLYLLLHQRDGPASAALLDHQVFLDALERLDALEGRLRAADMRCADAALVRSELSLSMDFLRHACSRGLALKERRECPAELAAELAPLIARYRALWGSRNRPGGLDDSARLPEDLLAHYRNRLEGTV